MLLRDDNIQTIKTYLINVALKQGISKETKVTNEREWPNKTYTSQVAESHIDSLINARHKRTKKMQWTHEGAHHVLQIRAMMASDNLELNCQDTVLSALGAVA